MRKLTLGLVLLSASISFATELKSNLVTVDGQQLHYYQVGNKGNPLVLLTGYATTSNFWPKDFIDCLATSHQVYLLDYASINTTESATKPLSIQQMATDTNQFVKKLKLKKVSLMGWSMGGGVALEASNNYKYQHLYLLSSIVPTAESLVYPFKPHGEFKSESEVLNYVFVNNLSNYESANLVQQQARFINPQLKSLFPAANIIATQGTAIGNWLSESANAYNFKHNHTPATFWYAKQDEIVNYQIAEAVIKDYPHKKVILIENSGHAVDWQASSEICLTITAN